MPRYEVPVWKMCEEAAKGLPEIFTPSDIIREIHREFPSVKDNTIRCHVIGVSPNHPSSKHYSISHKIFQYLGNGRYRLLKREELKKGDTADPLKGKPEPSEVTIPLDKIRDKLLEIEDSIAAPYFKNYIRVKTGIDPDSAATLDPDASVQFLEKLFVATALEVGGVPEIRTLAVGHRRFRGSLEGAVKGARNLHSIEDFNRAINPYFGEEHSNIGDVIDSLEGYERYGRKTAALLMKFLLKYSNFFGDGNPGELEVPVDRVVLRMTFDLGIDRNVNLDGKYQSDKEKLRYKYERVIVHGDKKYENSLNPGMNKKIAPVINKVAECVMGNENRVVFDNLWIVGHFYHGTDEEYRKERDCRVIDVMKIKEWDYLRNVEMPQRCPLYELCFPRSY